MLELWSPQSPLGLRLWYWSANKDQSVRRSVDEEAEMSSEAGSLQQVAAGLQGSGDMENNT